MKTAGSLLTSALLAAFASHCSAAPLGTAFTYQGRLTDGTGPANNLYEIQFSLYDAVINALLRARDCRQASPANPPSSFQMPGARFFIESTGVSFARTGPACLVAHWTPTRSAFSGIHPA